MSGASGRAARAAALAVAGFVAFGAALARSQDAGGQPMQLESNDFAAGGEIPRKFTCEGEDVSPELRWKDLPAGARSLVLILDDPDVPDPKQPKRTWVHWVLYDIPVNSTGLVQDVQEQQLPPGTRQGLNDWQRAGYGGPCPPIGRHRYFHKLYALDTLLGDRGTPSKSELLAAMEGHVLAQAELVGTYQKAP